MSVLSWVAVITVLGAVVLVNRTPFGRALYAAGGNPDAAVYAGIDVGRTRCLAFVAAGAVSGLCGYLWVSRYAVAYVDVASGFELDVIAACVIGGVSIAGGMGTVAGAVMGALFLGTIKNALPVGERLAVLAARDFRHRDHRRRRAERALGATPGSHHPEDGGEALVSSNPAAASVGHVRHVPDRLHGGLRRILGSWETLLLAVAVAVFVANTFASPYFLDPWNLSDATFNFTEKAMIAFAMALLIISGEIDLSVAAIIALASTAMGYAVTLGAGTPVLVLVGLGVGLACGAFNGVLVTRLGLPSIVATIGTMSLFRGIAYIVLGDEAYSGYPSDFAWFGQGYVGWVITVEMVLFALFAVIYGLLLHKSAFGRAVYAIGNNPTAALFSGVRVPRVKFVLFLMTGVDVRDRRGVPDVPARLDAPVDRVRLGARDRHDGRARRGQHPRRQRHDPGGRARGDRHGHGDLRVRSAERARHRHVDLRRAAADLGHRAAAHRAARRGRPGGAAAGGGRAGPDGARARRTRVRVAVLDVGKTNAKVALVDTAGAVELEVLSMPTPMLGGPPYPAFDVAALFDFALESLAALAARGAVEAIGVTTHGATVALLDADGALALPVLDYEHDGPDAVRADYEPLRSTFAETGSPPLPGGLNVGAQLHWQETTFPEDFARVAHVLTWPQYWAYRLCGELGSDPTSLGCHTDLVVPATGGFSGLAKARGWVRLIPPMRRTGERLGTVTPEVIRRTGLDGATPVHVGIHDSNASLVPYLLGREPPFAVVSTGTWVVCMAPGAEAVALDPARDTLVNVDAMGRPVPSAKFMGGREYTLLSRGGVHGVDSRAVDRVLAREAMLLPSIVQGAGPFPTRAATWTVDEASLDDPEHAVVVAHYLALVTATCLELVGARGPIAVEGPFAGNGSYLAMLVAATGRTVETSASATGTSVGTAMLIEAPRAFAAGSTVEVDEGLRRRLAEHAARWRGRAR